jgi:hypothetical protein
LKNKYREKHQAGSDKLQAFARLAEVSGHDRNFSGYFPGIKTAFSRCR